ncbi:hypothetical protein D3C87_1834090 [compost metagenome]
MRRADKSAADRCKNSIQQLLFRCQIQLRRTAFRQAVYGILEFAAAKLGFGYAQQQNSIALLLEGLSGNMIGIFD